MSQRQKEITSSVREHEREEEQLQEMIEQAEDTKKKIISSLQMLGATMQQMSVGRKN